MPVTALQEMSKDGAFIRTNSIHRNMIEENSEFPPEANRYHVYIALACPWANGVLAAIYLLGLDDIISVSIVHPTWTKTRPEDPTDSHCGWQFKSPGDKPVSNTAGFGCFDCDDALIPDPHLNARTIREVYEKLGDTGENVKYTTPLLYDIKQNKIVCNESTIILKSLNIDGFYKLSKNYIPGNENKRFNLYPAEFENKLNELDSFIYPQINNGVYRCGFAKSQEAYETAFDELFDALDRAEDILSEHRYICGSPQMTALDLRLFMTLVRFDEVYYVYFKTNKKLIRKDYPNLFNYIIDIYQHNGIGNKGMINMKHIKMHYYTSHPDLNRYGIVPKGDTINFMDLDHDRHNKV